MTKMNITLTRVAASKSARGMQDFASKSPLTPYLRAIQILRPEGKILRNAFSDGDAWFNTGDQCEEDVGFTLATPLPIVDRAGDTFRWKSENVSTNEGEPSMVLTR